MICKFQDPLTGRIYSEFDTPHQSKFEVGGYSSEDPKVSNSKFEVGGHLSKDPQVGNSKSEVGGFSSEDPKVAILNLKCKAIHLRILRQVILNLKWRATYLVVQSTNVRFLNCEDKFFFSVVWNANSHVLCLQLMPGKKKLRTPLIRCIFFFIKFFNFFLLDVKFIFCFIFRIRAILLITTHMKK